MSQERRERRSGARPITRNYITYLFSIYAIAMAEGVPVEQLYPQLARVIEEEVASMIAVQPQLRMWWASAVASAWEQYLPDVAPPDVSKAPLRSYDIVRAELERNVSKLFKRSYVSMTEEELKRSIDGVAARIIVAAGKTFFRMLGLLR